MGKPKYAQAHWNLIVTNLKTGRVVYSLNPDQLALTGSSRKLFSVGLALNRLGPNHRFVTPVYRRGNVDSRGRLHGNLYLVGGGDLTFGGRLKRNGHVAITNFDQGDADNLGTAKLTPQNPLRALNELARQVRASGIRSVRGDVVVDDRLFPSYHVPNQYLYITPTMVNEDMVDVTVTPTTPGQPARITYRPQSSAFRVVGTVMTVASGQPADITIPRVPTPIGGPVKGLVNCVGRPNCVGVISGTIPVGYRAPLSGYPTFVGTFRIGDPQSYARIAFIEALKRAGVSVSTRKIKKNPVRKLPKSRSYPATSQVGRFVSATLGDQAALILHVSLNLGANLELTNYGLTYGKRTIKGALAVERRTLIHQFGISGRSFNFPTNGSGSPDSKASPRAEAEILRAMSRSKVARAYLRALCIVGISGSLATVGTNLPGRGHIFAKPGTTVDGSGLRAQVLAGYIDAKSGRRYAFAVFVNNVGAITGFADVIKVIDDEAAIANVVYTTG
jgi:D-alanyl-D-alanine carboxypeptidase/D-alanyl-D-alanine-endopeptidase (penicillin-binding protein 4)